jgi:hypothetical protein
MTPKAFTSNKACACSVVKDPVTPADAIPALFTKGSSRIARRRAASGPARTAHCKVGAWRNAVRANTSRAGETPRP